MFSDSEPLDRDKLNQMANNDQWLYENTPRISYNAHGVVKPNGAKILAGMNVAPAVRASVTWASIYFGSFFSQGCRPIVVGTVISGISRTRYELIVRGIGTVFPDHRGCQFAVTTDEVTSTNNYHTVGPGINWVAVGW
jgi:hypothetical protein